MIKQINNTVVSNQEAFKFDIWSLGVILFKLITWYKPFDTKNEIALCEIPEIKQSVSDELKNIVSLILTPDFDKIPASTISIIQLPIIQTHLRKIIVDFEDDLKLKMHSKCL